MSNSPEQTTIEEKLERDITIYRDHVRRKVRFLGFTGETTPAKRGNCNVALGNLNGICQFNVETGMGLGSMSDWAIDPTDQEYLLASRGKLVRRRPKGPAESSKGRPRKKDPRQKDLF